MPAHPTEPARTSYDVVIIGGAMVGSAIAWFLADSPDFTGSVLVVERDPSFEHSSTAHTNSCMRQQFTTKINIRISQFAADYVKSFRQRMGGDERIPEIAFDRFGYMYLAATPEAAAGLRTAQALQASCGAGTRHLSPDQVAAEYPFYNLADILAANHNTQDEGYFDGTTLFDWWRRKAGERGVERIAGEVTAIGRAGNRVTGVTLSSGTTIAAGHIVNATGPRAARTASMAGLVLPVEPRKRYTFVFSAEAPLPRPLPLTIDPSGIHVRSDGALYMAGCPARPDPAVEPDDFTQDFTLWEEHVWPALAHRIPDFERIRLVRSWVGHYAFNTVDQNAILGSHPQATNFILANGFSGHGFQQAPAVGRGMAEWIAHGHYRTLDLSSLHLERIEARRHLTEAAII
ncbi:NAD(P)/FAD-dependent oxidoreductase [Algicella marina]|uniref:FAD-dependent oxidoreductase n=1 Tax=Algicella marina TaxID=2683284 RepID=A0A6P1T6K6_9RHOB|nr:FAD-binding oxidoreductase [Algicella marina]QHQ37451.1 FAD-dependent oxidoreductase [Algicella marina]